MLKQASKETRLVKNDFNVEGETSEIEQLRRTVASLTTQCSQLEEANRAWQQYEQVQLDSFRRKVENYLSIDENASFEEISQQAIEQICREREDFGNQYQMLEKEKEDARSGSFMSINNFVARHISFIQNMQRILNQCNELMRRA